jgi:hypothetical protein
MLTSAHGAFGAVVPDQRAIDPSSPGLRFTVARYSDNELVLFDTAARESWIVYPPRSAYDFLHVRRPSKAVTLVEHHPWAPFSAVRDHHLRTQEGCLAHGLQCAAHEAIRAAVDVGFNPFA